MCSAGVPQPAYRSLRDRPQEGPTGQYRACHVEQRAQRLKLKLRARNTILLKCAGWP